MTHLTDSLALESVLSAGIQPLVSGTGDGLFEKMVLGPRYGTLLAMAPELPLGELPELYRSLEVLSLGPAPVVLWEGADREARVGSLDATPTLAGAWGVTDPEWTFRTRSYGAILWFKHEDGADALVEYIYSAWVYPTQGSR